MEEEKKKNDKATLVKVLVCDAAVLGLIIGAVFLIKYIKNKDSGSSGYEIGLNALKKTLSSREANNWSRPNNLLSYESTYGNETHSFSYVSSPYNLTIDGVAYTGSDSQGKIDEAYALYKTYDGKSSIEGLITLMENNKATIESATYQKTAQEDGYYGLELKGNINGDNTLTYLYVEFHSNMYAKDYRTINGINSTINWTIG